MKKIMVFRLLLVAVVVAAWSISARAESLPVAPPTTQENEIIVYDKDGDAKAVDLDGLDVQPRAPSAPPPERAAPGAADVGDPARSGAIDPEVEAGIIAHPPASSQKTVTETPAASKTERLREAFEQRRQEREDRKERTDIRAELRTLDAEMAALEKEIAEKEAEIQKRTVLRSRNLQYHQKKVIYTKMINKLEDELEVLRAKHDTMTAKRDALKERLKTLQASP